MPASHRTATPRPDPDGGRVTSYALSAAAVDALITAAEVAAAAIGGDGAAVPIPGLGDAADALRAQRPTSP